MKKSTAMAEYKKEDLIFRVERAKKFLKHKKGNDAKTEFFDNVYGALFKAESTRLDNLWACKITDPDFTDKIEGYAENPDRYQATGGDYIRFMKFVNWYMKLGGHPLTEKDIEKIYPRFDKNAVDILKDKQRELLIKIKNR